MNVEGVIIRQILVEKIDETRKHSLNIPARCRENQYWAVWTCAPSSFDWHYDQKEIAYIFEGKVRIKTATQEVCLEPGDLVTFPAGLSCTWEIIDRISKVYRFE
ncbi:MAG: cupin domain-containing protein [Candidatus Omnitrophica bacterium]|nr:cupin domain-containing protein [Candidatus Omnitrophota bacterium]